MKAKTKIVKAKAKPVVVKAKVVKTQKVIAKTPAKKSIAPSKASNEGPAVAAKSALLMKKKVQTAEGLKRMKMRELSESKAKK